MQEMEFCMSSGFNPFDPKAKFPTSKPPTGPDGKPVKFQTIPDQDGTGNRSGKDYTTRTYKTRPPSRGPKGGLHHT